MSSMVSVYTQYSIFMIFFLQNTSTLQWIKCHLKNCVGNNAAAMLIAYN